MTVTTIKLSNSNFQKLSEGKTSTIHRGVKDYMLGPALIINNATGEKVAANIVSISLTNIATLTLKQAQRDGFKRLPDLIQELETIYPDINRLEPITVVSFSLYK